MLYKHLHWQGDVPIEKRTVIEMGIYFKIRAFVLIRVLIVKEGYFLLMKILDTVLHCIKNIP